MNTVLGRMICAVLIFAFSSVAAVRADVKITVTIGDPGKSIAITDKEQGKVDGALHLTWYEGETILGQHDIKDIDTPQDKEARLAHIANGYVFFVPWGHRAKHRGGDNLLMVTFDAQMHKITSVVDWRPRDDNVVIESWEADGDVVNVKCKSGKEKNVLTQFQVKIDKDSKPSWKASESRCNGGVNPADIEVTESNKWIDTHGSRSNEPKVGCLHTYMICLRSSPDDSRLADTEPDAGN